MIENITSINNNLNDVILKYCQKISLKKPQAKFKDFVREETLRQKENDYKLLSVVSSGEVIEQAEYFLKNTSSKDRYKYKIVYPMHFAFNPARANIGSIGMWNSKEIGCISPIYSVFKVKDGYELFFNYYLQMSDVKNEIIKRSSGSVRQNLSFADFEKINLPFLSVDEINSFNKTITPIWNEINKNKSKIKKLNIIKSQFLNKYFN